MSASSPFLRRQCWPITEKLDTGQRGDFLVKLLGDGFLVRGRIDVDGHTWGATQRGMAR